MTLRLDRILVIFVLSAVAAGCSHFSKSSETADAKAKGARVPANTSGTIERVRTAKCQGPKGTFLNLERKGNVFVASFGGLGQMTNKAEGQNMPLEVQHEIRGLNITGVGSLVSNSVGFWGSMFLTAPTGRILKPQERLEALFLETTGGSKAQIMNCELTF